MSRGHQGHTLSAANEDAVAASEKFRCIHQRLFVHPVTSRKADCICSLLCRCAGQRPSNQHGQRAGTNAERRYQDFAACARPRPPDLATPFFSTPFVDPECPGTGQGSR